MNGVRKNKKKLLRALIPVWICFVIGCLRLLTMTYVSGQSSFSDLVEGYAARMFRSFDERSENIREVEWYGNYTRKMLISNIADAFAEFNFADVNRKNAAPITEELKSLAEDPSGNRASDKRVLKPLVVEDGEEHREFYCAVTASGIFPRIFPWMTRTEGSLPSW